MIPVDNLRARVTGETWPIRRQLLTSAGVPMDITGYTFALTVDPNENPASTATNLWTIAGSIVDAATGVYEFELTQPQADLLVPLAGNAAYWCWEDVTAPSGETATGKMRLPVTGSSSDPETRPVVTGAGGAALVTGQVITGESNIRAIVLANNLVKVTHQTPSIAGSETLAHYLWISDGAGGWTSVMSPQYGDWTYPVVGATVPYDSATVIEASDEAVEVAFRVNALNIAAAFGGLGVRRRDDANEALDYPVSSSTAKSDTSIRFTKTIRVERGKAGYFVGIKTYPDIFPGDSHVPSYNDVPDYGEVEVGQGADVSLGFSMVNGVLVARASHPAWGADARWAAAETAAGGAIGGRPCHYGIYDPDGTYQPTYWANSTVRATQHALFPYRPTTGPWVVAAIRDGVSACIYMALRHPMLVMGTQYAVGQTGQIRILYYRQKHGPNGNPYGHAVFIGAFAYAPDTSSAYANEPTAELQTSVAAAAAAVVWPA